jgi:hypothetical protein
MDESFSPGATSPSPGRTLQSRVGRLRILVLSTDRLREAPAHNGVPMRMGSPVPCSAGMTSNAGTLRGGALYCDSESGLLVRCVVDDDGILTYEGRALIPVLGSACQYPAGPAAHGAG